MWPSVVAKPSAEYCSPLEEALRGLFAKLHAEIQRIKSEGDYAAGRELVEKYATL